MDKNYSLQIFHSLNSDAKLIAVAHNIAEKINANIFFQGRSQNWLMIEFWISDQDIILEFCEMFASTFSANLELIDAGSLSLKEIDKQREMWQSAI